MRDIFIERINQFSYRISISNNVDNRQLLKVKIYFNAIPDADISIDNNIIVINYRLLDEHIIATSINKIVKFFEKLSYNIQMDNNVNSTIQNMIDTESKTIDVITELCNIKRGNIEANSSYNEFCDFCDNNLVIKLRLYQYKASFLLSVGNGGFDFSVPGSGKTIITYSSYMFMKSSTIVENIFIIGPMSSFYAWYDEFNTCFGHYPDFENLAEQSTLDSKVYLNASKKNYREVTFINFDKIRLLINPISNFLSQGKTLLVIDEAHKIKNPNAEVAKALLKITKKAKTRILLTGTPMPNGYEDLYTLTKVLSPFRDILPYNYKQLHTMTVKTATQTQNSKIRDSLFPFYSRISKKYLIETGELTIPNYYMTHCEMTEDQRMLYDWLSDFYGKIREDIDEDLLESFKKAILIRKMQISANPGLLLKGLINSMDELRNQYIEFDDKYKNEIDLLIKADKYLIERFKDSKIVHIINQYDLGYRNTLKNIKAINIASSLVKEGKKVLIWDIFIKNMEILYAELDKVISHPIEMINGSIKGFERQNSIYRFREGDSMILIANPATLAESISLHKACQNAIYVNRNFNAAQFIQSKDRIHRINMPENTTANYYMLLNNNSVDYSVDERLRIKEKRMFQILDSDSIEIGGSEMEDMSIMSPSDIEDGVLR